MSDSFKEKVSKGVVWVLAAKCSIVLLQLIIAAILTRLLDASDFGLMAVGLAVMLLLQNTTSTGFEAALIQRQEKVEDYISVAWTFELLRHLLLFLLLFLFAPVIASFLNDDRVLSILRVMSVSFIFRGFRNMGVVYFRKNLEFKKQYILDVFPIMTNLLVAAIAAYYFRTVWALVAGSVSSGIMLCALSYIMHPFRPRFDFSLARASKLLDFGIWVLCSGLLVMFQQQGITLFAGRVFGMSMLGYLNRAEAFSSKLYRHMVQMIWNIGFPAFSKVQDDKAKSREVFLRTMRLYLFIALPVAGGMIVMCDSLVRIVLTEKWIMLVPLIQIMSLFAVIEAVNTPSIILFQSAGKPKVGTLILFGMIMLLSAIIYPLSQRMGIVGVPTALVLSALCLSPFIWLFGIKISGCSVMDFLKAPLLSIINTIGMMVVVLRARAFIDGFSISGCIGLIVIGVLSYVIIALLIDKVFKHGVGNEIKGLMLAAVK